LSRGHSLEITFNQITAKACRGAIPRHFQSTWQNDKVDYRITNAGPESKYYAKFFLN